MKIRKFWARGYRSLRDVTLDDLGAHVVFYGPNGSGKSNLLAAMETLLKCLVGFNHDTTSWVLSLPAAASAQAVDAAGRKVGDALFGARVASSRDFARELPVRSFSLGGVLTGNSSDFDVAGRPFERLTIALDVDEVIAGEPRVLLRELSIDGLRGDDLAASLPSGHNSLRVLVARVSESLALVPADRSPRREAGKLPEDRGNRVPQLLRRGRLKQALFAASTSVEPRVRRRLRAFRELMEGPPLRRPSFDAVLDPDSGEYDIREPLGTSDVSLDLVGLGIAQAYAMMAGVLLSDSDMVAIEEPEAHLHAPSLGLQVRQLLVRAVAEGHIHQLFLATHSNLFDLDPTGYWDVSLVDGATMVVRKPLDEIDRLHLFEPGPAKHQIQEMLRLYGDEVVFRTGDGHTLTATEMLASLQNDDAVAKAFLDALHAAALQVTGLRAKRARDPGKGAA
jgi:hypothetical protein